MLFIKCLFLSYIVTATALINNQVHLTNEPSYCNASTISCHWSGPVNSCCSPKYGLVVLALQWVPNFGPTDEFTIHGLWPDTCSGKYAPSNGCDSSRRSNEIASIIRSRNSTLYHRMITYWPSYKGDNNWFWSHEWTKHGTCVSTLRPSCYGTTYKKYDDVLEYFEKVLTLRDEYDLFGALNLNGVSPGRTYNVNTIRDAIKQALGADVRLDCDRSGQLTEVSLFFYVKGRDHYMITNAISKGSCRDAVYYPKK
ncbi:ribonuclease T2-like protein [Pilobolus umbonatus]|nr:ribonuclease T2-like protein [Pilobolus umbonatus]